MAQAEAVYDVIVVGSGAAGLAAATFCAAAGLDVCVLEKDRAVGGTTAISGGMVWVPDNKHMRAMGGSDSVAQAETYLESLGGTPTAVRRAVLEAGPRAIALLEERTQAKFRPVKIYPDYYPDKPGATLGGRVLEPVPFDGRRLGAWFARVKPPLPAFTLFGGMMVDRADIPHFRKAMRSVRSFLRVAELALRYGWQRLSYARGTTLYLGNALVARLLASALDAGARVETGAAVTRLAMADGGGVAGVILADGRTLSARRGVILCAGGFPHGRDEVAAHLPAKARAYSAADSGDTGDGICLGRAAGAAMGLQTHGNAFWVPVSLPPGAPAHPHTVTDRGKPGSIIVDRQGRRFANEARSYHQFVEDMLAADAVPCHLVCDAGFLWRYGLGTIKPFALSTRAEEASGYLVKGGSLAELAVKLGINPAGLESTVAGFNVSAVNGADPAFGRGADAYQRHMGDGAQQPNPCLAPILQAPFYAVTLHPGTLGTAAGLQTDAAARVLDAGGQPIPGLFAAGNDANSVMDGTYPGPGITLGPALTLAFLASQALTNGHK